MPKDARINIIGHSWGGDTAAKAAIHSSRKINTLVTIDPVSRFQPDFGEIASRVGRWIDVDAESSEPGFPIVARTFGRAWRAKPQRFAQNFIATPLGHEEFAGMMDYKPKGKMSARDLLDNE